MKAIIVSYNNTLNGVVIDALEHYAYLRSQNECISLLVVSQQQGWDVRALFKKIALGRFGHCDWADDIIIISRPARLLKFSLETALIFGSQEVLYYPYIKAEKLIVVKEYVPTMHWYSEASKWYETLSKVDNVLFFREYECNDIHAKDLVTPSLFAFDLYRKVESVPPSHHLISLASKGSVSVIPELLDDPECEVLITYGADVFLKDKRLITYPKSVGDLFSLFGTYVYNNQNNFVDPRPRLFVECKFYGKEIKVVGPIGTAGARERYCEYLNTSRDEVISNRTMTLDKPLIQQFLH